MKARGLWLALVASLSIACGGAGEAPPETAANRQQAASKQAEPAATRVTDATPAPRVAKRPKSGGKPVIRVLEAGAEPRATLRYSPAADARETLQMVMKMNVAIGSPDRPGEPMNLPGTSMRLNLMVDSVEPNGDVAYRFEIASVDIDGTDVRPQVVEQIKSATQRLIGVGGRAKVSSRGVVQKLEMKMPGDVDPATKELVAEIERSMSQMWDPFPEAALGKGARWDVQMRYSLRGIDIDQVRRYTLVSRDGNKVELQFIVEQTARPQPMRLPNLPPGAVVRLEQLASAGDGVVLLDTSKMVPPSSKLALRTTSVVHVQAEQQKQTVRTDMSIDVTMSGPTAAKPTPAADTKKQKKK